MNTHILFLVIIGLPLFLVFVTSEASSRPVKTAPARLARIRAVKLRFIVVIILSHVINNIFCFCHGIVVKQFAYKIDDIGAKSHICMKKSVNRIQWTLHFMKVFRQSPFQILVKVYMRTEFSIPCRNKHKKREMLIYCLSFYNRMCSGT